ncbi:hypothetical protein FRC10_001696 [Ceratobasidium sp. 414]|nr:hypothetical protein FRC10_001696 [Ceratobasidium sp. 414]
MWMEEEDGSTLLFVLNISNSHWVAGCTDLVEQLIQIGDSLGGFPDVRNALEPLQTWFHHIFGQKFPVKFKIPTGEQTDRSSCGLFSVNALAMCALGDVPLTHQARNLARASGFLVIVRLHLAANERPNRLEPSVMPTDSQNNIININDGSDNEEFTNCASDELDGEQADEWEGKLQGELDSKYGHENTERSSKSGDNGHPDGFSSTDGCSTEEGTYGDLPGGSMGASTESLVDLNTRLKLEDEDEVTPISGTSRKRKSTMLDAGTESETTGNESRDESEERQAVRGALKSEQSV